MNWKNFRERNSIIPSDTTGALPVVSADHAYTGTTYAMRAVKDNPDADFPVVGERIRIANGAYTGKDFRVTAVEPDANKIWVEDRHGNQIPFTLSETRRDVR
jgi:hypothetical protein